MNLSCLCLILFFVAVGVKYSLKESAVPVAEGCRLCRALDLVFAVSLLSSFSIFLSTF